MLLMKSMSQELAPHKICINSIGPGAIKTPINADAWYTPEAETALHEIELYCNPKNDRTKSVTTSIKGCYGEPGKRISFKERIKLGKQEIIAHTIKTLDKLPTSRVLQLSDFAEFLLKQYEEEILQRGMTQISSKSEALSFLEEEEELYSVKDLKERY